MKDERTAGGAEESGKSERPSANARLSLTAPFADVLKVVVAVGALCHV